MNACTSNACGQDSRKCPCPASCIVALNEPDDTEEGYSFIYLMVGIFFILILAAAAAPMVLG